MIASFRENYNIAFTEEKYQKYLSYIANSYPNALDFRIAETPIFINAAFTAAMLELGNYVNEEILAADFKKNTQASLVGQPITPNENEHPHCLVMDFAIALDEKNNLVPKLIELQGFPSLFAFEVLQDEALKNNFSLPENYSPFLNGYTKEKYLAHLKQVIIGTKGEHTVLLELYPHQQKTRIDFYCTQKYLGIPIVCITELIQKGKELFYISNGTPIKIERIYNRIVMDELNKQPKAIQALGNIFLSDLNISWVSHPHHFFRISKFILPFLHHPLIPKTQFVHALKSMPKNLEAYILKPLFSFAGQGVIIDIQAGDLEALTNPEHWILQEKVKYAECIKTPSGPAKAEIRLFYFWDDASQKYIATMNLARLSKGIMIGVDYNKNKQWVGGSLAYFENN